jgi:hypothetical protein
VVPVVYTAHRLVLSHLPQQPFSLTVRSVPQTKTGAGNEGPWWPARSRPTTREKRSAAAAKGRWGGSAELALAKYDDAGAGDAQQTRIDGWWTSKISSAGVLKYLAAASVVSQS